MTADFINKLKKIQEDVWFAHPGMDVSRQLFGQEYGAIKWRYEDIRRESESALIQEGWPIHVGPECGEILAWLVSQRQPKTLLEIGTLFGYSTLWIMEGMSPESQLWTIEKDPCRHAKALTFIQRARREDEVRGRRSPTIHTLEGDARKMLNLAPFAVQGVWKKGGVAHPKYGREEKILESVDFVFLDADKLSYPLYAAWAAERLTPGGVLVIDNMCLGGAYTINRAGCLEKTTDVTAQSGQGKDRQIGGRESMSQRRRHPPRPGTLRAMDQLCAMLTQNGSYAGVCLSVGDGLGVFAFRG